MANILIEKDIMVPMRDGVQLATDIYRLEGASSTPVLVVRTLYNKDDIVASSDIFNILRAVQAGYTVVTQDVRGRYASEGMFDPHVQETADGLDAFAWEAAQPWSNGLVGNIGSEKVMDYTVVGLVVNVAKRLQEIVQGGQIMVSEETFKLVKGSEAEKLEALQLPHLQERITAYLVE